jgi:hypothetical protein
MDDVTATFAMGINDPVPNIALAVMRAPISLLAAIISILEIEVLLVMLLRFASVK